MTAMGVKYNLGSAPAIGSNHSGAANGAVTGYNQPPASAFHPDNPMLWLVGLGAVTLGLIGVSTHVRVGKISAGIDAGDT